MTLRVVFQALAILALILFLVLVLSSTATGIFRPIINDRPFRFWQVNWLGENSQAGSEERGMFKFGDVGC